MSRRAVRVGTGLAVLAGLAGLAVMVALIAYNDASQLGELLIEAGWGIALVTAIHAVAIAIAGLSWQSIARPCWPGGTAVFVWARSVRESVGAILPVMQIGGDAAGARILTIHGARAVEAVASLMVDVTVEFVTLVAFTVLGIVLLLVHGGGETVGLALIGLAIALATTAAFLLAQRFGLFRLIERALDHMAVRLSWPALGSLAQLHDTVFALYRDRRSVAAGAALHMLAWLLGAVEVWIILRVLGVEAGFGEALIIESLGQAIRAAAFFVPAGLGVQEGGFLALGVLFGLPPEIGLAVSLVKRIRELALGVPVLVAWQVVEGRRLLGPAAGSPGGQA